MTHGKRYRCSHLGRGGVKIEAWNKGHTVLVLAISLLVYASPHRRDRQKHLLFAPLCAANSEQRFVHVSDPDLLSGSLCHVSVNRHAKGRGSSASILIESLEFPSETQKGI